MWPRGTSPASLHISALYLAAAAARSAPAGGVAVGGQAGAAQAVPAAAMVQIHVARPPVRCAVECHALPAVWPANFGGVDLMRRSEDAYLEKKN